jgi:hypothetical protein
VNSHNSQHAFCGGYLAGYQKSFDATQALIHGAVSESMSREGIQPFYCLEAMEGLAQRRFEQIAQNLEML